MNLARRLTFPDPAKSYLSSDVYHLICEEGLGKGGYQEEVPGGYNLPVFLDQSTLTFDLHRLEEVFQGCRVSAVNQETPDYYVKCVRQLAPMLAEVEVTFQTISAVDFRNQFCKHIDWIADIELFSRCIEILYDGNSDSTSYYAVLLLSLVLERSLGDLVLTRCTQCPSLLRDLLLMNELRDLLCDSLIWLLRVLIGPPISLNLRNIAWHGFLSPGELHPRYCYVIVCVLLTIGHVIYNQHHISDISHRPFIRVNIPPYFTDIENIAAADYQCILEASDLIPVPSLPFWSLGLRLFEEKRYGECCSVLLPQLESILRRLYVTVNDCPNRLLTAQNAEFFTTLEEILDYSVNNEGVNQLSGYIDEAHMAMLLDMFVYPGGQRLRDRMSHGEVRLTDVNKSTAQHLINISISISMLCVSDSSLNNIDERLMEWLSKMKQEVSAYQSLYHPISLLKNQIATLAAELSSWQPVLVASLDKTAVADEGKSISEFMLAASVFSALVTNETLHLRSSEILNKSDIPLERILDPVSDISQLVSICLECKMFKTNLRYAQLEVNERQLVNDHCGVRNDCVNDIGGCSSSSCSNQPLQAEYSHIKSKKTTSSNSNNNNNSSQWSGDREKELIKQLSHCCKLCSSCSADLMTAVREKQQLWLKRQLRSRQRLTYQRLISILPKLLSTLRLILCMILSIYLHTIPTDIHSEAECFNIVVQQDLGVIADDRIERGSVESKSLLSTLPMLQQTLIRLMRQVEQICDKLLSCIQGSKWEETLPLVQRLLQLTDKLRH